MQKMPLFYLFVSLMVLASCDNEVDLNADIEDTTVVYGLLDISEDTQFVKINRAFLEDGANAIQLAKETDRLFYDNLDVKMVEEGSNDTFQLSTIEKRKDEGIFSNERNVLFFTTDTLASQTDYQLIVRQANGKTTTARSQTLRPIQLIRPGRVSLDFEDGLRSMNMVRITSSGFVYQDYEIIVRFASNISEIQVNLYFNYEEEFVLNDPNSRVPRTIKIPVGSVRNTDLGSDDQTLVLGSEYFYSTIAAATPDNSNRKVVPNGNIDLEIIAVDVVFGQYTSVYGPLDGLAQVRPEFSNINNGVGLFASRSTYRNFTFLESNSLQELRTGPITGNLNFVDP